MSTILTNMTTVSDKLKTRIDQAEKDGKNVDSLRSFLSDMNSKITSAKSLVDAATSEISGLTAAGYPDNKAALSDARSKIKDAYQDIKDAYSDGKQIIHELISMANINESGSSSAKTPNQFEGNNNP